MIRISSLVAVVVAAMAMGAVALTAAENPPAPGFNIEASDPEAIVIADQVMERLGGRDAWDRTRFVTWNFFGRRRHVWDKHTGDIRIEGVERDSDKPYIVLMNLHTRQGRAWSDGEEITDTDELATMLDAGESAWINDSYWLFMPYKLKDTGVTLEYVGEGTMVDGRPAEILQLTFEGVGRTPQNKYLVYVARDTGLVEQWDYFPDAGDEEPRFQSPWHNWQRYGEILLSDDRGDSDHTDIAVFAELPEAVLSSPAPVDWEALLP